MSHIVYLERNCQAILNFLNAANRAVYEDNGPLFRGALQRFGGGDFLLRPLL
jgi:hypothetical protein